MRKKGANLLLCILFRHSAEKLARNARLIDRGPENRQHGNKPYFTRVSLPFSAGNAAATAGNMLLLFVIRRLRSCIKIAISSGNGRNMGGKNI
jgi:hypothetical protein